MAHDIGVDTSNEDLKFKKSLRDLRSASKKIENLKYNKFNKESQNGFNVEDFVNDRINKISECLSSTKRFITEVTESEIESKILEFRNILDEYYNLLNENSVLFIFNDEKNLDSIVEEIESIIRGDIGKKLTEYGKYYEKIEPLIKIQDNFLELEDLFIKTDDGGDSYEIAQTLDNVKAINIFFKNKEKYKFFIILPLDYLINFENKTETFLGIFSDRASTDSIVLIKAFYDVLNSMSFVGLREFWSSDYFWDAVYKYEQSKKIHNLSKKLESDLKKINNFKELEDSVIEGYDSSLSENFSLMDKVKNDIRSELALAKSFVAELEKEKNAVLQYSEDVKNTDAVKVYSNLYNKEILIAAWFRFTTLLVFGILSVISLICLIALFLFPENNFIVKNLIDTDKILGKIPFIITFFVFGFYLAKEGEKHRRIANQAKQTEGELIALASYTNGWDSKEIKELKTKLADKYFGKNLYETEKALQPDSDMVKSLIEQTKVTTDLVKSLKGTLTPTATEQTDKSGKDV